MGDDGNPVENVFPAWVRTVSECVDHFKVSESHGLSEAEVEVRRELYGWNELQKEEGKPMWRLVLEQFDDTLVKILLAAALVSFVLAFVDGLVSSSVDSISTKHHFLFQADIVESDCSWVENKTDLGLSCALGGLASIGLSGLVASLVNPASTHNPLLGFRVDGKFCRIRGITR